MKIIQLFEEKIDLKKLPAGLALNSVFFFSSNVRVLG